LRKKADQHAPEAAAHGTCQGQVGRLMELDLALFILGDDHHVFHVDQVLFLHLGQLRTHAECGVLIMEFDCDQLGHCDLLWLSVN